MKNTGAYLGPEFAEEVGDIIQGMPKGESGIVRQIIAVDGRYGVGKSVLSRYLGLVLGISCIHMDDYFEGNKKLEYHVCLLETVRAKIEKNEGIIVDGIFSFRWLAKNYIKPDYLIRLQIENRSMKGHRKAKFDAYEKEYKPTHVIRFLNPFYGD
jgi:uridine kinase